MKDAYSSAISERFILIGLRLLSVYFFRHHCVRFCVAVFIASMCFFVQNDTLACDSEAC